MEVKKGLFKHEGLIDGLIEIAGLTGNEYDDARQYAVWAMDNIADGDDEVKAGLFHFPGLMTRIEGVLLDANLEGSDTKLYATELAFKLLQWQRHDSVTFKTFTMMLKLCSKKLTRSGRRMRATPNKNDAFAVFFHNGSDVAKHILSFLDTNSDQLRRIAAAMDSVIENDAYWEDSEEDVQHADEEDSEDEMQHADEEDSEEDMQHADEQGIACLIL
jgi:hypothetical protein